MRILDLTIICDEGEGKEEEKEEVVGVRMGIRGGGVGGGEMLYIEFAIVALVGQPRISTLSCAGTILKESTCLLRHITAEKSGSCQYVMCITRNTKLKK